MRQTPPRRTGLLRLPQTFALTLLLQTLLSTASLAQQNPTQQPAEQEHDPLVERSESVLVDVPVHVSLGELPLKGLTIDQFELFDRGKRQVIESLDVIDLQISGSSQSVAEPPLLTAASRRHFLLLFDMSFTDAVAIRRSQLQIQDWVLTALHPWDLVGVARYSTITGVDQILGFTSDREQLALAIGALGLPQYFDRGIDPLALEIGIAPTNGLILDAENPGVRNQSDASGQTQSRGDGAMAALREIYHSTYEPMRKQGERRQIRTFTQSMTDLASRMRAIEGQKHVIYLSQGYDASLAFAEDDKQEIERMNAAFNENGGNISSIDGTARFGDSTTLNGIMEMIDGLKRADCVVQAVQIGAASGNESLSSSRAEGLFALADGTGGELYRDYNNLDEQLTSMINKTSVTYVLSFSPTEFKERGRYHKLRVKLKDVPGKARLTHRPGYYEPDPARLLEDEQLKLQTAQRIMTGDSSDGLIATEMIAPPFPVAMDEAYVPVLIEIDGASLPVSPDARQLSLDVYLYAIDSSGGIADFLTQRLTVDLGSFRETLAAGGIKFFGELMLPKGEFSLRLFVRENRSQAFGVRTLSLKTSTTASGAPLVLPPLLPDRSNRWLIVRESSNRSSDAGREFPFLRNNEPYIPSALPAVTQGGEAEMLIVAYNLGEGPLAIETSLIDLLGATHDRSTMRILDRSATRENQELLTTRFRPKGLVAGRYTMQVKVTNERSGATESSFAPIRILERERATETLRGSR